jgi:hypothetical protein
MVGKMINKRVSVVKISDSTGTVRMRTTNMAFLIVFRFKKVVLDVKTAVTVFLEIQAGEEMDNIGKSGFVHRQLWIKAYYAIPCNKVHKEC